MYRLARSGGSQELLRWVSGRAEGWAGLLDGDGTVLHGVTRSADRMGAEAAALATEGAKELASLGASSFAFDRGPYTARLFPLGGPPDAAAPVLAVVAPRPLPDGLLPLLSDVAMPLAMCWAAETVERKRRRVDLAESRSREAVLHLLMTGQLSIAHQVAGALRPTLPDPVRVCVVECPGGRRDEVARICTELSAGRSWIVRCPVYARHLILVVPADPDAAEQQLGLRVADVVDECVVGASEDVPLSDTATGYRQAFHALAVARGLPGRHACFGSAPDAALVVGAAAAQWADALLHPLLTHLPRRSHDPGSQELAATLSSWLAFSSHATQHLKIHRNTLTARLRLIGELLGLDLHRVADQAALDLALRIRATPTTHRAADRDEAASERPHRLDDILRGPAVQEWAARQLRPLTESGISGSTTDPRTTLRAWLDCEAQLGPTAAALGISVPGVRKRLTRLESTLHRSLLRTPSARYDLWLAFRALDLAG
ncbi:helix-turn-helix domain-containing protein [Streptomyces sp. NBC_01217]|uniref:helix-turn-helix domain-containing protein n=1 Tax=Streptomyces sp. NBC_01217 TaxID=2903779 RepID=UPI002E1010E7|nr:helix-turn-helix domain-containing protein [Streptomyces sp. NBC_01217]